LGTMQNNMLLIGLTGGIGTGKSTVSKMFKDEGLNVIDADIISREVLDIYPEIIEKIKNEFGIKFVQGGKLNRRLLGDYIFSSKERKEKLEAIIIPFIIEEVFKRVLELQEKGESIAILDAPTLYETGLNRKMDKIIVVYSPLEIQIERIIKRDKMTYENAVKRIDSQISIEYKKSGADYLIDNGRDIEETKEQFNNIIRSLKDEAKKI
ncbi:MAG: dephospho-CoA kinase, partial [Clostridiaceae bacterium]